MAISSFYRPAPRIHPAKLSRRTATSVMAGAFDIPPPRDVLTSVLNGVPPYKAVEKDDDERRMRKKLKRERDRERQRRKREEARLAAASSSMTSAPPVASLGSSAAPPPAALPITVGPTIQSSSSFWRARPTIQIATMQRFMSVTPPPVSPLAMQSSPASTPQPSISSSTSRTSSKRPRTPDDDEDISIIQYRTPTPPAPRPRKKRVAVKKGWKGWVEGSPPPSEKLIQLDAVPVLQERRTRSGKNFDAIGVGKDGWV